MTLVISDMWTDQIFPTIEPATLSPREAAVALLKESDWYEIIETHTRDMDIDPLVVSGVIAEIEDAAKYSQRDLLHVVAWMTAHMVRRSFCANPDHEGDDIPHMFDYCGYEDDEDDLCEWHQCWACIGDLDSLIAVTMERVRDGWMP